MLQTPLNKEDASTEALEDPEWHSEVFGCWTPATADLPLHQQESAWPARWTSKILRMEKEAAIRRNKLSLWLREKECRLVSPETSAFVEDWLNYYDLEPEHMTIVMSIDPVPPPTDIQVAKGLRGKDYEAFVVMGRHMGKYYLLDYSLNRGHEPDWTVNEFFRLALKWRPRKILVETTAYQKTLSWILTQAMKTRRQYFVIKEHDDKRSKFDTIVDGLSGIASNDSLFVRSDQTEFIAQFRAYPDIAHDDLIEGAARAAAELQGVLIGEGEDDYHDYILHEEKAIPTLAYARGAP